MLVKLLKYFLSSVSSTQDESGWAQIVQGKGCSDGIGSEIWKERHMWLLENYQYRWSKYSSRITVGKSSTMISLKYKWQQQVIRIMGQQNPCSTNKKVQGLVTTIFESNWRTWQTHSHSSKKCSFKHNFSTILLCLNQDFWYSCLQKISSTYV